jgi:hypothetical protein
VPLIVPSTEVAGFLVVFGDRHLTGFSLLFSRIAILSINSRWASSDMVPEGLGIDRLIPSMRECNSIRFSRGAAH